jgi:hypothetical protein
LEQKEIKLEINLKMDGCGCDLREKKLIESQVL